VKLAQAGFGDFLADSGVGRLKGKCDGNKEEHTVGRVETESGGTRRRTGGEVKGKEANGVGSQAGFSLTRNSPSSESRNGIWWHTETHGWRSEGKNGEWRG